VPEDPDALARGLHEAYLRERVAAGEALGSTRSLVAWDALPEEYRESSRRNARDLYDALASLGYRAVPDETDARDDELCEDDVEAVARTLHERWLAERTSPAWVEAHGSSVPTTHDDLVPWDELPDERRTIDRNLVRQFPSVLGRLGLALRPAVDEPDG
jgi:hypothetical protein